MTAGSSIAAEIAAALAEAGAATGDGPLIITLEKAVTSGPDYDPVQGDPIEHSLTAIDDLIRVRDASGALTGETRRVLTLPATGVVPAKGDWVAVRGARHRIGQVAPVAPGGVDLMYECTLEA
jgi:hypothetical protein